MNTTMTKVMAILALCTSACAEGMLDEPLPPDEGGAVGGTEFACEFDRDCYAPSASGEYVDTVPYEERVVSLVNDWRAQPVECRGRVLGPSEPVVMDEALRAAARGQSSASMEPSAAVPLWDRAADFNGVARGEIESRGLRTPDDVVRRWVGSDDFCSVLLMPEATHAGVGYRYSDATDSKHYWTFVIGTR